MQLLELNPCNWGGCYGDIVGDCLEAPCSTHTINNHNEEDLFSDAATSQIAGTATDNWSKHKRTSLQSSGEGRRRGYANITIHALFNIIYGNKQTQSLYIDPK